MALERASRKAKTAGSGGGHGCPGTARVLVVDDHRMNQAIVSRLLKKWGYRVDVAENGRQAVDMHATGAYDIVLMDLSMPEMDGFEATTLIRSRELENGDGKRVPIIALTACAIDEYRERCFAVGMDEFETKPLDTARLRELIRKHSGGGAPGRGGGDDPGDH